MENLPPQVTNTHWSGGVEKLPKGTVYIGRPGPYGNPYSSKSGAYSKEECVALHRIDLYRSLIEDPGYKAKLTQELEGHDLACWCKNHKRFFVCHGDNYLHVFTEKTSQRAYDKTVLSYLMDDLRTVLSLLSDRVMQKVSHQKFLTLFMSLGDTKIDIREMMTFLKSRDLTPYNISVWVAFLVIDLEAALADPDEEVLAYRLEHALWVCQRFFHQREGREEEPINPRTSRTKLDKPDVDQKGE